MTLNGILQIAIYLCVLVLLVKPIGNYMASVYQGEPTFLNHVLKPVESLLYRLAGIYPADEMNWKTYAFAMLLFNAAGMVFLYALQRLQGFLPFNPQGFGAVSPDSAFNTAVSFVSNTNWQGYAGETTMSYLTQMLGLTTQNFLSAASGMAILVAFIRGIVRTPLSSPHFGRTTAQNGGTEGGLGNFWVDMTRSTLYILLPLSIVLSMGLVSQGVIQTFSPYQSVALLQPTPLGPPIFDWASSKMGGQGGRNPVTEQIIALGPTASQIAIKQLGTNGGGFFNVNSAHPFENPTPLTDFLEMLSILLIPAALCYTFGKMVKDVRQGWAILAAMMILLVVFSFGAYAAEASGNPQFTKMNIDQTSTALNPGGNLEGKEVRFGVPNSALWATVTTAASNGSVNAMHDSFTPLGGLVTLVMMQLGEVIFGGVGSGLYGMLAFVIVSVFVSGLMVGRTPEYLGKKIEAYEMKMASLIILIMPLVVLGFTALAVVLESGKASVYNPGAHGFSEILYAFTSTGNNNGSAFAGLNANTPFYNLAGGLAMLIARYWLAIPALAIAGSLALKKIVPTGAGTLPTHTPLFIGWLIGIVIVVGALNFLPALALGPIVEHLILLGG